MTWVNNQWWFMIGTENINYNFHLWTGAVHGQCPGVCQDDRVVSEGVWVGGEGPPQTGGGGQQSSQYILHIIHTLY